MTEQEATNKVIQDLLDLLVEAQKETSKLDERIEHLEWQVQCLIKGKR